MSPTIVAHTKVLGQCDAQYNLLFYLLLRRHQVADLRGCCPEMGLSVPGMERGKRSRTAPMELDGGIAHLVASSAERRRPAVSREALPALSLAAPAA